MTAVGYQHGAVVTRIGSVTVSRRIVDGVTVVRSSADGLVHGSIGGDPKGATGAFPVIVSLAASRSDEEVAAAAHKALQAHQATELARVLHERAVEAGRR